MCQSQLSSPMLPSAAPTPPCAATVWERVGKTFESTATRRPACASSSDARMPEPPAPTITASNLRTGMVMCSAAPEDGRGPDEIRQQRHRGAAGRMLRNPDVHVEQQIADAGEEVVRIGPHEDERDELHARTRDQLLPAREALRRVQRLLDTVEQRGKKGKEKQQTGN